MAPRLQSKEVREVAALIASLGYQYDRADGSHHVYRHESQAPLVLAGSPSDHRWRANMLAELRRRHPDAAILRGNVRTRPVDERRSRRGRNGANAAATIAAVEAAQTVPTGPETGEAAAAPVDCEQWRCRRCRDYFWVETGRLPHTIDGNGVCPSCFAYRNWSV